jgi:hypothetical protein
MSTLGTITTRTIVYGNERLTLAERRLVQATLHLSMTPFVLTNEPHSATLEVHGPREEAWRVSDALWAANLVALVFVDPQESEESNG